jgi:hypothetical protein
MYNVIHDVHTRHCCKLHGCKYGDDDCTVTTEAAPQEYLCEDCSVDIAAIDDTIEYLMSTRVMLQEVGRLDKKYMGLLGELCWLKLK